MQIVRYQENAYDAVPPTVRWIGVTPQLNTRRHDRAYCKRRSRHLGSTNQISVKGYSISAQSTTGYLPHFLLFGRKMQLQADLYYNLPPRESASANESVANLRQVLAQVHKTVTANMKSRQKLQKDCYDRVAYGCRSTLET